MRPVQGAVVFALGILLLGTGCSKDTTAPPALQSCSLTANNLSFGTVNSGACSAVQTFTLTNFTSSTLNGSISEACPDFEIVSGGGAYSLGFGQTVTVTARFCPQSNGDKFCTLETGASVCSDVLLTGRGGTPTDCQITPAGLNFGSASVGSCSGTQSFTIQNSGTGTLTGTVSEVCADFEITAGAGPYTLTAGQTRTVTVRFCPQSAGDKVCTIETGLSLCSNVTVIGHADLPSQCQVSPGTLAFGSVAVGACSATQTFIISNPGTGTLSGSVSESCADFEITGGGGAYSLSAGQTRTITVRFCPQSTGDKSCTIETGLGLCSDVTVSGTGLVSTGCQVIPVGINFGSLGVGNCTTAQTFVVTNNSSSVITGTVSETCADFEITGGGGAYILGAGQSLTVTVRFCPQSAGDKTCTIDTGSGICTDVTVVGTGTP